MSASVRISNSQTNQASYRLVWRGLKAAATALGVNALIFYLVPQLSGFPIAIPVMGPGTPVMPMPFVMVVMATLVPSLAATGLLAILRRFTTRAGSLFQTFALVFLLLSFAAPFSLPVPLAVRLTLASMHVVTAASLIYFLTIYRRA